MNSASASAFRPTRRHLLSLLAGGTFLLASFAANPAHAEDLMLTACNGITPATSASHYPGAGNIILSNDLARPAGKAQYAAGQLLRISGRVTDENCVPVANAIVDLWQANPFGEYRWAARDELLNPEPIFAGNGRAVTDNLGRFNFTTLFPGSTGNNAPVVQFRVTHPDFKTIDTAMYFKGDRRNATDSRFKAFSADNQSRLLGKISSSADGNTLNASHNITLKGRVPFRSY
ncbi:MAG: hypothetical protein FJX23_06620 [Alphaproteobacteria bacterium]|nr:hypothetical protein [Alphaproteobacteria bacterium]